MVTDVGGLGDHSYNDAAYAGLQRAHAQLGVKAAVLQSRSVGDFAPMFATFTSEGYDEIFAVGFDMAADLGETVHRFPHQHFAIIDAVVDAPNVTSVTFREEEGSYLAGALAAMVSKTRTIGFLGGMDVPLIRKFEAGYFAGARQIDPAVQVRVKYVGDFNDVAAAAELSGLMYGQGADIIYTAAGKAGLGTIDEARGRSGVYVIGVNSNQDGLLPGKILTSVLKRLDESVFRLCQNVAAHQPLPHSLVLGLKEGGVGLTDFHYTRRVVTPRMIAELAKLQAAIVNGRIHVPRTRAEFTAYRPVRL